MRNALKAGFTLIELLVTLILLGLLTAVVFPVVVQQIDDAEPTKAANDFANIKTGIEVFHLNVRPTWPGDLEDLVHQVATADDDDVNGNPFNNPNKWNGPYIDAAVPLGTVGTGVQETGDAVTTGYGMVIQNQLVCYNATANTFQPASGTQTCVAGTDFVALLIDGETTFQAAADNLPTEFVAINELVDNEAIGGWDTGKVRMAQTDGTVFPGSGAVASYIVYLVAPFTN